MGKRGKGCGHISFGKISYFVCCILGVPSPMYIGILVIMYLQNPMGKILLIAGIAILWFFSSIGIVGCLLVHCPLILSSVFLARFLTSPLVLGFISFLDMSSFIVCTLLCSQCITLTLPSRSLCYTSLSFN